jgi:hypothetical protein
VASRSKPTVGTASPDSRADVRRRVLKKLQQKSTEDLFQLAVRAGIYTKKGRLSPQYRKDASRTAVHGR